MTIFSIIDTYLSNQITCMKNLDNDAKTLSEITEILIKTRDAGHKIILFGNGGSASTSSHFASDLLKTAITKNSKRFMAMSLTDNVEVLSAWANDVSFNEIFIEQLKNFLSPEDVLIAISGSGKSPNVLKALEYGKQQGSFCIGLTGMDGGKFPSICDICLTVPSNDMLTIESIHLTICHCIVTAIRTIGEPVFKYDN